MDSLIVLSSLLLSLCLLVSLAVKLNIPIQVGVYGGLLIGCISMPVSFLILKYLGVMTPVIIIFIECFVILSLTIIIILFRFFRDPERIPPMESNVILSPADGTVRYIYKLNQNEIPISDKKGNLYPITELSKVENVLEEGYLIGIEMSVLDNHINRSPIDGNIILQKASKGKFLSLRSVSALFENERVTTIIENNTIKVVIIQIASRLVRRIVSYQKPTAHVQQGERIGMIRFGSQVDLIIPQLSRMKICIHTGEHVKAGETIIARV